MKVYNDQKIDILRDEIKLGIRVFDCIYEIFGNELKISWTTGGKHAKNSLHYKRRAFDCLFPEKNNKEIIKWCRYILGYEYDIIEEKDHIHIEWDPK